LIDSLQVETGVFRRPVRVSREECIGAQPLDANFHGIVGRIAGLVTPPRRDPIS
jgi:hypothetical protein